MTPVKKTPETYSVTIEFTHVRGLSDLLLKLIRVIAWFDSKNDIGSGLQVLAERRRQPIVLRHNGLLNFGTVKVVTDAN